MAERRFPKLSIALAVLAAAAALLYFLAPFPRQAAAPKEPVTLAVPTHPTSFLAFVALEKGYFAAHGLEVTRTDYPSGKRALEEGLLAGKADIAWANEVPVAFSGFGHSDFRVLASTLSSDNANRIIARRDAGIRKPEDLRGKRIGTQKGSAVHFFLHLFLLEHGLAEKDVKLSFFKAEELPTALAEGKIDAMSMREPFISQAQAQLGGNAIIFQEPGLYEQMDVMLIRDSTLKRNPQIAAKALGAMLDAETFVTAHPRETLAITAKFLQVEPSSIEGVLSDFKARVALSQSLLVLLESEARWAIRSSLVSEKAVPDYLSLFHTESLRDLHPEAVTVVR